MKQWLIKKLGGYTLEEITKQTKISALSELTDLKYEMEANYGSNWEEEIYTKVVKRIVELSND